MPKFIVKLSATADVKTSTTVEAEDEDAAKTKALEDPDVSWDCNGVHTDSIEVSSVEKSGLTIVTRRDQLYTDRVFKKADGKIVRKETGEVIGEIDKTKEREDKEESPPETKDLDKTIDDVERWRREKESR